MPPCGICPSVSPSVRHVRALCGNDTASGSNTFPISNIVAIFRPEPSNRASNAGRV